MTKKSTKLLSVFVLLLPVLLALSVFLDYQIDNLSQYIKNYEPKPVESVYFEETLNAYSNSDGLTENKIELFCQLYFYHYRSYPTQIRGAITVNGEN